jgi:hypothetical protein
VSLIIHALINFLPTYILGYINGASVVWHVTGAFCLMILIPAVAPTHQDATFVFGTFYQADVGVTGDPSSV